MIKRPALCAYWVLCAVTGLVLFRATIALAQSEEDEDAQSTLKSAVQRELDAMYERDGKKAPNMNPSARSAVRTASSSQPGTQRTASGTPAASAQSKSDVQKQLEALYARDGREMPEMNFPAAKQTAKDADDEASEAAEEEAEELDALEEKLQARRRSYRDAHEEVEAKPSLLQRINPFKSRSKPKEAAQSRSSASRSRGAQTQHAESARRQAHTAQELQPETPDSRLTESKSGFRFLPNFLKRREPVVPQEPAARSTEESIANRSRRAIRQADPSPRDERSSRRSEDRAVPHETAVESLAQDAPKKKLPAKAAAKAPTKAPKQDVEEWLTPSEEKSEQIADKPAREEHRKGTADKSDLLESPFEQHFDVADKEPARTKSKDGSNAEVKVAEKTELGGNAAEQKVAATSAPELRAAPRKVDAEKSAQAPFQDEFPNPFTEVTENEADKRGKDVKEIKDENPFTGLKLGDEKLAATPKIQNTPAPAADKLAAKPALKVAEVKKEELPAIEPRKASPKPAMTSAATPVAATNIPAPKIADAGAPNPFEPDKAAELPNTEDPLQRAKMRRLGTRRGLAGLKGFCPVALRDRRDLVDTNPEFTSTFEGRLYQFSSADAKSTFDAEPEKYAPALGGVDIIIQANSHQTVDGTLDHAVWFHDKLYLFSSSESLEAFVLNPLEYARDEK